MVTLAPGAATTTPLPLVTGPVTGLVTALPRGGLWMSTPLGALQLGAPPETLKDTLTRKDGVPRIIVLPRTLVDVRRGLPTADLEFPIYWNLFVKKRPLIVVGTADQEARIRVAVQESLLGPVVQDLSADVAPGRVVPNLQREQRWFRRGHYPSGDQLSLDDAIDFRTFAPGQPARIEDVVSGVAHCVVVGLTANSLGTEDVVVGVDDNAPIHLLREAVAETKSKTGVMTAIDPELVRALAAAHAHATPFAPPRFGVTVLGRSHGFDPDPRERTTGFILWVGGRGVLVDPPVHSTGILRDADIDAGLVDTLILTHVHGDHDSGLLQKALEAGRTTLFTVPIVFSSWLRKWSALSGIPEAELSKLFDFRPVQVGRAVDVHGAKLIFRFTLHSIPTIAFEAHYEGASFNYSGDTLNDPTVIDEMYKAGFMDPARREQLNHFDWSHDLVFHESGVPPLHTPLSILTALDDDTKARLRVLHVTPARLVEHPDLLIAEPGRAATIELPVEPPPELKVLRHVSLLGRTRLFSRLPLARAAELIGNARELHLKAGEQLIREGSDGDTLYVITGGKASVQREGRELKVYGLGDYLGESAVFSQQPRNADVFALTDLDLLSIDGAVARRACRGTDIPAMVERHNRVRAMDAWALLERTSIFSGMTTTQKNAFETLLVPFEVAAGGRLLTAGMPTDRLPLLLDGNVDVDTIGKGSARHDPLADDSDALIGDIAALLALAPQPAGATVVDHARGFFVGRDDVAHFLEENPGLRVRVQPWTAQQRASHVGGMALMITEHLGRTPE